MSIFDSNNRENIFSFFKRRRKLCIYGSTIQGKNWSLLNATKSIFLILALVIFTSDGINLTQGEAIAMYSYINQFLISLLSIPVGVDMFTTMSDVIKRLKTPI
jgi:hypothetical protein